MEEYCYYKILGLQYAGEGDYMWVEAECFGTLKECDNYLMAYGTILSEYEDFMVQRHKVKVFRQPKNPISSRGVQ